MGRAVAAAVVARPGLELGALIIRAPDAGLATREAAMQSCDVIVDFTSGAASAELATLAARHGGPALVIGSTGFDAEQEAAIAAASARVAIVKSGNFSLGVNVLLGVVAQAARALPASAYDIEILEAHHRRKVDAPSGTALMLGAAAAGGRGQTLAALRTPAREGVTGPRAQGSIGFAATRGGGIVGEHSVIFAAEDEILTLSHSARDRGLFARGAVEAAVWLVDRPAGLYDMQDVLGFKA
jgi:4-hydroxy-tetrahydrodipicolinate reductase